MPGQGVIARQAVQWLASATQIKQHTPLLGTEGLLVWCCWGSTEMGNECTVCVFLWGGLRKGGQAREIVSVCVRTYLGYSRLHLVLHAPLDALQLILQLRQIL